MGVCYDEMETLMNPVLHLVYLTLICLYGVGLGMHVFMYPKWHQQINFILRGISASHLKFWGLFAAVVSVVSWMYLATDIYFRQ